MLPQGKAGRSKGATAEPGRAEGQLVRNLFHRFVSLKSYLLEFIFLGF